MGGENKRIGNECLTCGRCCIIAGSEQRWSDRHSPTAATISQTNGAASGLNVTLACPSSSSKLLLLLYIHQLLVTHALFLSLFAAPLPFWNPTGLLHSWAFFPAVGREKHKRINGTGWEKIPREQQEVRQGLLSIDYFTSSTICDHCGGVGGWFWMGKKTESTTKKTESTCVG